MIHVTMEFMAVWEPRESLDQDKLTRLRVFCVIARSEPTLLPLRF